MKSKVFFLSLFIAVLALAFQNCSQAKFSAMGSDFNKAGALGEDDHVDVEIPDTDLPDEPGPDITVDDNDDDDGPSDDDLSDDELDQYACPGHPAGKKVLVCHNGHNPHTICISVNALKAHVGKHDQGDNPDTLGACAAAQ